jgi:membrane protease subunit HflC
MNTSNSLNHENKNVFLELLMKKLLVIFLLILFIIIAVSNTLVVQEDELVVIKQFGRVEKIIDKPGLYFKLPLVQNTDSITKKLNNYEVQPIKVITKDNELCIMENLRAAQFYY